MHSVLFYESFFFCPRNDLERLQPLSRSLHDIIENGSNVLPLRPIYIVMMDFHCPKDCIGIFVEEVEAEGARTPDYEGSIHDGDFTETFFRLQNVCIKYFGVGIRDSPFLHYWKTQETAAFTVVSINVHLPEAPDYDVLDSIVNHLRPRRTGVNVEESSWQENGDESKYLELLARDSYLHHIQTCRVNIKDGAFPPPSFILNEPGYTNYELWSRSASNTEAAVDGYIESFLRDGCANEKLKSVSIMWATYEDEQSPVPKHLREPTKVDMVPLPNDKAAWFAPDIRRVSQCAMRFFENTKQWKRLETYKWSVQCENMGRRRTNEVILCHVKNL